VSDINAKLDLLLEMHAEARQHARFGDPTAQGAPRHSTPDADNTKMADRNAVTGSTDSLASVMAPTTLKSASGTPSRFDVALKSILAHRRSNTQVGKSFWCVENINTKRFWHSMFFVINSEGCAKL